MSKTIIYYFSGTGNSRFVAERLKDRITGAIIKPIVENARKSTIENAQKSTIDNATKSIGFTFPCHFGDMPYIVKDFIGQLEIPADTYIFAVVTRGGGKGDTLLNLQEVLSKKGCRLHYGVSMRMQMTYLPAFYYNMMFLHGRSGSRNTQKVNDKIERISLYVKEKREFIEWRNPIEAKFEKVLNHRLLNFDLRGLDSEFSAGENCSGCGICADICPVKSSTLSDGKPVWQHNCTHFMGRINYCSREAIEYGGRTAGKRRYHHPQVTVKMMKEQ
ncbi:MAG: EFR1 family ferrodoxin [Chitinispirillaceae bacterium]|nr:EFR1 family ferrodoxin [Chitinispirillaceae bacterium]